MRPRATFGRTGRTVAGLAVGAVALTIVVVAVVARLLVPSMPWAVAVALGAIVAAPLTRRPRPPYSSSSVRRIDFS